MAREVKSLSKGHTERKWGVEFNLEFVKLHSLSLLQSSIMGSMVLNL